MTDTESVVEPVDDDERSCYICDGPGEECFSCDEEGLIYNGDRCWDCGGSGYRTPSHCCDCGGSPYCNCCPKCHKPVWVCGCTITVQLSDGTTKTLEPSRPDIAA